ncbi:hypothetical protein [Burkholderia gladioli]|uniref:hypothetical protein n=1 Tax=Burkholderia gladioli TaxID=28095 RepID=UPI001640570A|nr:hypothetical protein [Burkholderia gladioli]
MTTNTTAALTDEQLTIQWAIESIEASAKSLQECHTQNGTWGDDTEAQSMFEREMEIASALRALLTSPRAAGLPEGWKLVPIKPTKEMMDAVGGQAGRFTAYIVYTDMLDAAPAAPVAEAAPYFSGVSELIIRDVCEMEPANPDLNDTICIDVSDLQAIVKRHTEVCATCNGHGMIGGPSFYAPDEGGVPCPDCNQAVAAPVAEPMPAENAELASMTRMFHAACADLGLINEALGLDPDDGGAEPILDAIQKLKDERDQWADAGYAAQAVAADGESTDDLLQLDVLLANLHAAVWHAGAGDDGPVDYDMAGKDEAKAIQRHVRAMLAERAAVSPATASLPIKIPHIHIRPEDEEIGRQYYALGFVDGSRSITDAPATAEKVYYGGSVEAGPVAFDETPTADERTATSDCDAKGLEKVSAWLETNRLPELAESVRRLAKERASQAAAPARIEALRKGLFNARDALQTIYENRVTSNATIRHWIEEANRVLNGEQAAAPALVPPFKRYNWDGKESEAGPLVFFLDVLEALKIVEDEQAAAPAEAREPIYQSRLLKAPAWTDVSRAEFEACAAKPDQFEVRTLSRVPADAGEAVAKPRDCSGAPESCPDNEGYGCHCSDAARVQGAQGGKGGDRG